MIKTIHKVELRTSSEQEVWLPLGAIPLRVEVIDSEWFMWYEFDIKNEEEKKPVTVEIFGTGHLIEGRENLTYVNTFFQDEFVWHVYWRKHG